MRHAALLAVLLVLVFTSIVRLRLADAPLERDEGEYAYAGQLILQGVPPYTLAYNMKFPGTYYAYSAIVTVFGQTPRGIRLGLLLINAATTLLLFQLGKRVLGRPSAAAVAAGAFALLSLDRWVSGPMAHATHFVLLPAVGGLVLLLRAYESDLRTRYLMAGVLFGLAVLMKQHAIAFALLAFVLLFWYSRQSRAGTRGLATRGVVLAAGMLLPFALICAVFAGQGVLGKFWFWTFDYAREYVSQVTLSTGLSVLAFAFGYITTGMWPLWLLGGLGLAGLWLIRWPREQRFVITSIAAASFLAICPGLLFRDHYFILMLPVVALCAGAAVVAISRLLSTAASRPIAEAVALGLAVVAGGYGVVTGQSWMFGMDGTQLSRAMYDANPFPEAVEIGKYLASHTSPGDRIAVLGSEPEIYFYAQRPSATGYIYMYPLTESQAFAARMQDEFMQEVETARTQYVVFAAVAASWMENPRGDARVYNWAMNYVRTCYDTVGVADIDAAQSTLVWDAEAAGYQPRSRFTVITARRKHDAPCSAR